MHKGTSNRRDFRTYPVEMRSAIVLSTPPSGPNDPPVIHCGPDWRRSITMRSWSPRPLVGNPKSVVCEKFQPKWRAKGSQRLRDLRYAKDNHSPARNVLTKANVVRNGFPTWALAKSPENRIAAGRKVVAWITV
jgi:hypothetical protein